MGHISIDIETFSSVDIGKSGLYRYVEAPDFQILLFAYSVDGGPVEVIDLTSGPGSIQEFRRNFNTMLLDPAYIKHAYNAAFEWYCLSKSLSLDGAARNAWLSQWRCTMLHSLYCGYPASLAAAGSALGLPEDKRKLTAGRALIRTFCVPCTPTPRNGRRTRTHPHHEPEKWELFKGYNQQDVVTEMEIERRLSAFPVPEDIQRQWELDQAINARGVAVDRELVAGALHCSGTAVGQLRQEAALITGLDNPGSVAQLSKWLREETGEEVADLRKDTVADMLGRELPSDAARRLLEIRQELSKTSTKKYNAMEAVVGADGRARGLLQFYGANRTGRWAGRLIQVQNLPRTHLEPLGYARQLVRENRVEDVALVCGGVPDTLSQLIRTAFIPSPGNVFVDADFSAIEARVIAWLAGEEWVLEVFRTHGKIYEACAAQMFGVPIERIKKGRPEYGLRQKGKVATLALGYQGGSGALIQMGALRMGIPEEDLPDIVRRWRSANKRIVDLWYSLERTALAVLKTGNPAGVRGLLIAREFDPATGLDFLSVSLPSGRKLYYAQPAVVPGDRGDGRILYHGMNQATKKWGQVDTYGGKLAENCVQAIARDCLMESIQRLEAAGYPVVFHVHDEVVLDVPRGRADLEAVCGIMAQPIPWAPDLPLKADGWIGEYYTKE